jgi:hypothetical protein
LLCHLSDVSCRMQYMFREMIREWQFAEELGNSSFTIPEHRFTNALVRRSGLFSAGHLAAHKNGARNGIAGLASAAEN